MNAPLPHPDRRLIALSEQAQVENIVTWPERVDTDALFFPPALISIAGTPEFRGLDPAALNRLSLFEAANFFSLNIHGETHLTEGLADRLDRDTSPAHAAYLRHFLAEEKRHSAWFASFCDRYAGRIYPDRSLAFTADDGPDADVLFFARIAVFEEIVDTLNRAMARDLSLAPIARAINAAHHSDETRHLAFGHRLLRDLVHARAAHWTEAQRVAVARRLTRFAEQVWRALFNPAVYADAGLGDPLALRQRAMAGDAARHRKAWLLRGCRRLLARLDFLEGDDR